MRRNGAFAEPAGNVERRLAEIGGSFVPVRPRHSSGSRRRSSVWAAWCRSLRPRWASFSGGWCRPDSAGEALVAFLGVRVGFAVVFFAALAIAAFHQTRVMPLAMGAAGLGFLLPGIVLARMETRRMHRIRLSFLTPLICSSSASRPGLDWIRPCSGLARNWCLFIRSWRRPEDDQPRASRRQGAHRGTP